MSVDLPDPFCPNSPCTSPERTVKSTSRKARCPPKVLDRPRTSRARSFTAVPNGGADLRHHDWRIGAGDEVGRPALRQDRSLQLPELVVALGIGIAIALAEL